MALRATRRRINILLKESKGHWILCRIAAWIYFREISLAQSLRIYLVGPRLEAGGQVATCSSSSSEKGGRYCLVTAWQWTGWRHLKGRIHRSRLQRAMLIQEMVVLLMTLRI